MFRVKERQRPGAWSPCPGSFLHTWESFDQTVASPKGWVLRTGEGIRPQRQRKAGASVLGQAWCTSAATSAPMSGLIALNC